MEINTRVIGKMVLKMALGWISFRTGRSTKVTSSRARNMGAVISGGPTDPAIMGSGSIIK